MYNVQIRPLYLTQGRLSDETNRLDVFGYNPRSELAQAIVGTNNYAYLFDPIGNREQSVENAVTNLYTSNTLNQYTNIIFQSTQPVLSVGNFSPVFDADGNQMLIRTATGIWHVRYNGENRPICFSNDTTVVDMNYDYMGRRFFYRETINSTVTRHERHLYRGYLRIVALDMLNTNVVIHAVVWDPTESVASRPLLLSTPSDWHTYGFDQVKNVTELFDASEQIVATYDYAPFGAVTKFSGLTAPTNPVTFSSEVDDSVLGLIYYNWRHLNIFNGRWLNRDPIAELFLTDTIGKKEITITYMRDLLFLSLQVVFVSNNPVLKYDFIGLAPQQDGKTCFDLCTDKYRADRLKCTKNFLRLTCPNLIKWGICYENARGAANECVADCNWRIFQ